MNETQKVIKYFAIAFAIFLIVSIVSSITMSFAMFSRLFSEKNNDDFTSSSRTEITESISSLEIELYATNTTIREGNQFIIETNNNRITTKNSNGKLVLKERKGSFFKNKAKDLVIYLPKNVTYDNVSIDAGAGKIEIEKLSTKKLSLDLGAGEVEIAELNVTTEAVIDGGAGKFSITNGNIHNLDLDMGVGKLELTSLITGDSKIEAGVGETDINLLGNKDDYKIKINKGLGGATIEGNSVIDNTYYGNGSNYLFIDGGVGKIDISFKDYLLTGENQSYSSEFMVEKYLLDTDQSIIFIGKKISGSFKKGGYINLLDENNNVVACTTISLKNPEIYEKEIDRCSDNEACAFIVENITIEEAKTVKKVELTRN